MKTQNACSSWTLRSEYHQVYYLCLVNGSSTIVSANLPQPWLNFVKSSSYYGETSKNGNRENH